MALPKIEFPTYVLTLPLSKKEVTFRPFLVKEQKLLMMAMESGDKDSMERAVKQILNNCTLSDLDINKIPLVDVEFFFLNIRARSVGEIVDLKYRCENLVEGNKCGHMMEHKVDLLDIKVDGLDKYNDIVKVTDKIGIKFNYPEFSIIEKLNSVESASDVAFELVAGCVDYVFDDDQMYYAKETTKEEMMAFLQSLSAESFEKIDTYFDSLPSLKKVLNIRCGKCGFDHSITVQGLDGFFA